MRSRDFHLTPYDKAGARRTLKVLFESGKLTAEDYENRKLLVAVAGTAEDLEKIFLDIGGIPESSRIWRSLLKSRGRQLKALDAICLVGFVAFLVVAHRVLHVEWVVLLFPALVFIPVIPRVLVDLNREEELYYETGKTKK